MHHISPTELARRMASARDAATAAEQAGTALPADATMPFVLDIREAWEIERASIPGTHHLAMSQIIARISELDPKQPVICMCHHGGAFDAGGCLARNSGIRRRHQSDWRDRSLVTAG